MRFITIDSQWQSNKIFETAKKQRRQLKNRSSKKQNKLQPVYADMFLSSGLVLRKILLRRLFASNGRICFISRAAEMFKENAHNKRKSDKKNEREP